MKNILAADIGGTNSRFAYFQVDTNRNLSFVESKWLKTRNSESFNDLLNQLSTSDFSLPLDEADAAVFAVAGPVEQGTYSKPPNIHWEIDISEVQKNFGIQRCVLINDFVAQAFACRSPVIESAQQVVSGKIEPKAPLAVIGAGTGLGQAALVPQLCGGYVAIPSEGGHASFPFETQSERVYLDFLLQQVATPYIRAEVVVSGKGLSLMHQYLTGKRLQPVEVAAELSEECETLNWMARFYGRVCRNYALQILALGGVYIAGGVAAKIPTLVTHQEFMKEFRRSETMGHVLEKIPVLLNKNEESGLWGSAVQSLELFRNP
jgi:glucokinase